MAKPPKMKEPWNAELLKQTWNSPQWWILLSTAEAKQLLEGTIPPAVQDRLRLLDRDVLTVGESQA